MDISVLVFQEEKTVEKRICKFLQENGYNASGLTRASEMYNVAKDTLPQIVITDISGLENASEVNKNLGIPFVVVSAVTSERVKVKALDSGGEDYIVRPFSKMEFLARLRVVQRRFFGEKSFSAPGLEIDLIKRQIIRDGKEIVLTPVEYRIVELLCSKPGNVFTHECILKKIWGPYVHGDNKILRVNITNIRKKLEPDPSNPVYIKTENGIGYRMSYNKD